MVQLFNDDFLLASCMMFAFLFSLFWVSRTIIPILSATRPYPSNSYACDGPLLYLMMYSSNMPQVSFTIFPVSYLLTIFTLHGASVAVYQ
jgi:hypothetical protein